MQVCGKPVLAVVLSDHTLTYSLSRIRLAINRGGFGQTRVTKDFLIPGEKDSFVTRNVNSRRRKCEAINLSQIDSHSCDQLKAGK